MYKSTQLCCWQRRVDWSAVYDDLLACSNLIFATLWSTCKTSRKFLLHTEAEPRGLKTRPPLAYRRNQVFRARQSNSSQTVELVNFYFLSSSGKDLRIYLYEK